MQIALYEPPGDALVFLPGQEEIEEVLSQIEDKVLFLKLKVNICPLYANLPETTMKQLSKIR